MRELSAYDFVPMLSPLQAALVLLEERNALEVLVLGLAVVMGWPALRVIRGNSHASSVACPDRLGIGGNADHRFGKAARDVQPRRSLAITGHGSADNAADLRQGGPRVAPLPSDVAVLLAVPTICLALALAILVAPRAGLAWAGLTGLAYLLAAAIVAPRLLRRNAERLRDTNRRFLRGFEDAAIGMAILTRELRLVRVNDSMCRLLARPSDQLVGHSILEFTHPET